MQQLPVEQQILLITQIAALAILCLRMWATGLYRIYVYFFGYLVLELLQTLIPLLVPLESRLYQDLYYVSEALIMACYALVVLELYSKVFRDLEGIASTARRYIQGTLVVSIGLALLPLPLEQAKVTLGEYFTSYQRIVMSALVIFVLLVSFFLVYYPVPLGRNVIAYLMGYSVYFLTHAATSLIINLGHYWIRQLSSIAMGVSAVCLIFWIIALSRAGENQRVVIGHQWNLADEQKLRTQLAAINSSLLRASGK